MKTKALLFVLCALAMVETAKGQFLKNLAKKAEQAAERHHFQPD